MFVTRPAEPVLDRPALGLAPAEAAVSGVYALRASESPDVTVVLQESAVAYAFVQDALPLLEEKGVDALVYYVASAELFDLLPPDEQRAILPEARAAEAMGITGFTLPTLYRWVTSDAGRGASLYPFRKGHYLGSGPGEVVLAEAGLDGASQAEAILRYIYARAGAR
jgi:transketolase